MKELVTIRIYFEYGQKIKNISFWKRLNSSDFSTEIIKKAKAYNLRQVLSFSVSKGYLENGKVFWGISETKHFRHPHVIEIIDTKENIDIFLKQEEEFLSEIRIIIVKNEVMAY